MPTFDGGHYFLTALAPIRTDIIEDGAAASRDNALRKRFPPIRPDVVAHSRVPTSPVHALRKRLDLLATAQQTAGDQSQSPFARNTRNHFVRLVIIDDVAYNGRVERDTLVAAASKDNLVAAQPQDHLSRPFLLFAVDFDARSGDE